MKRTRERKQLPCPSEDKDIGAASDSADESVDWTVPLAYKPNCRLIPDEEPASPMQDGWWIKMFRTEKGEWFMRERAGGWERWSRVIERKDPSMGRDYKWKRPAPEPFNVLECEDRVGDFSFVAAALTELLTDADERRLFEHEGLERAKQKLEYIGNHLAALWAEVEELKKKLPERRQRKKR